jgi:acetolactate synthase small subunit
MVCILEIKCYQIENWSGVLFSLTGLAERREINIENFETCYIIRHQNLDLVWDEVIGMIVELQTYSGLALRLPHISVF